MKFLLIAALACSYLCAADYYVSPTGSASGDGSISKPWNLQSGIESTGVGAKVIKPGDTVWMRGGTYTEPFPYAFEASLSGTATAPIIIRAFPGERPTIVINSSASQFTIKGQYQWLWGLEWTANNIVRYVSDPVACNANGGTSWCGLSAVFADHSPGSKVINSVIHDISQGFSFWDDAVHGEFYGNVVFNNGWNGYDRGHGHSIYTQNKDTPGDQSPKVIADNILFNAGDEGIQAYGSGNAAVSNFLIQGNTIFNNGILEGYGANYGPGAYQVLVAGGGSTKQNITVDSNLTYMSNKDGYNTVGWQWDTSGLNVSVTNNIFTGSPAMQLFNWNQAVVTGNKVISNGQMGHANYLRDASPAQSLAAWSWDHNTYYGNSATPFAVTTQAMSNINTQDGLTSPACPLTAGCTFAQWQTLTGFDKNSTVSTSAPTGTWSYVRPNKYEKGRANITIYNWDHLPSVSIDPSASGIQVGDSYKLLDAENFYGPAILSGVYAGGPISVPMNSTVATQAAGMTLTIKNTQPEFGAFVFLSGSALTGSGSNPAPPPPPTTPPTITFAANPSTITAGQPVVLTWAVTSADTVTISGSGAQQTSGSLTLSPKVNTTYTLTAANVAGSSTQAVSVVVNPATTPQPANAPVIVFTASPATITPGQSSTLSWTVSGATSLSLMSGAANSGAQPASRALVVTPASTTVYTLTATNTAGVTTQPVTVTVQAASTTPPPVTDPPVTQPPPVVTPPAVTIPDSLSAFLLNLMGNGFSGTATLGMTNGQVTSMTSAATVVTPPPPTPSAFSASFNFRATAAGVADPKGDTYALGIDVYPTVRNGLTFGWQWSFDGVSAAVALDRSGASNPEVAGIAALLSNGTGRYFRVDLPGPGAYKVSLALGDHSSARFTEYAVIKDGATVLTTVGPGFVAAANYIDATGATLNEPQWAAQNKPVTVTVTGSALYVYLGTQTTGDYDTIAHLTVSN